MSSMGELLRSAARESKLGDESAVYVKKMGAGSVDRGLDKEQVVARVEKFVQAVREMIEANEGGYDQARWEDRGEFAVVELVSNFEKEVDGGGFGQVTQETRSRLHSYVRWRDGDVFLPNTAEDGPALEYGVRANVFDEDGGVGSLVPRTGTLRVFSGSVVELVRCVGVDMNDANVFGETALMQAASIGHVEVVKWLLKQPEIVVDRPSHSGCTPLLKVAEFSSPVHFAIATLLLENGANPNHQNKWKVSALHVAAYMGNLEMAQLLVERGADRDVQDVHGRTPSYYASEENCGLSETNESTYSSRLERLLKVA